MKRFRWPALVEAQIPITFETWPAPRPVSDDLHGVRLTPEGDMVDATEVYGLMYFGRENDGPAIGIGEPMTFEAKKRYVERLLTDVFGRTRPEGEVTQ